MFKSTMGVIVFGYCMYACSSCLSITFHVHEHILLLRGIVLYSFSDGKGGEKEQECGKE